MLFNSVKLSLCVWITVEISSRGCAESPRVATVAGKSLSEQEYRGTRVPYGRLDEGGREGEIEQEGRTKRGEETHVHL